jgi:hypothetical protein
MKKAIILVGCPSLLIAVILSVLFNDSDKLKGAMSFTFTGSEVTFLATAPNIVVDWGDGKANEYTNAKSSTFSHTYQNRAEHTVRIRAEELSGFSCNWQQLTALDVSGCAKLTVLECADNSLIALDVSHNTELTTLGCEYNQLTATALNALFASLPPVLSGNIYIRNNPGIATCDRSIAAKKGWRFMD